MNSVIALTDPAQVSAIHDSLMRVHPRFALLWLLGVSSGFRVSDMLSIRVGRTTDDIYLYRRLSLRESKTGNFRRVSLPSSVCRAVYASARRLRRGNYLFWGSDVTRPCSRQYAHRLISRVGRERELYDVGTHSMRKIYACNLYRVTGSLKCVQASLGHKSKYETMTYLRDVLSRRE